MKKLDLLKFTKNLKTNYLGKNKIHYYEQSIPSTMNIAKELIQKQDYKSGDLIIAEEQSQGRGRSGRSWLSFPYNNLYFTFILKVKDYESLCKLNLSISIAVSESIRKIIHYHRSIEEHSSSKVKTLAEPGIKWPNDVWLGGKKVSGMLIDSMMGTQASDSGTEFIVSVGVGINVNQSFNAELEENQKMYEKLNKEEKNMFDTIRMEATSVRDECNGEEIDREELLSSFCNELEHYLSKSMEDVLISYKKNDLLIGNEIIVMPKKREGDEKRKAIAVGLSKYGNLQVKYEGDESISELISEEVTIRPEDIL